jgi:uncharacterized membrane protein
MSWFNLNYFKNFQIDKEILFISRIVPIITWTYLLLVKQIILNFIMFLISIIICFSIIYLSNVDFNSSKEKFNKKFDLFFGFTSLIYQILILFTTIYLLFFIFSLFRLQKLNLIILIITILTIGTFIQTIFVNRFGEKII